MENEEGQHRPLPVPFGQAGSWTKLPIPRSVSGKLRRRDVKPDRFTPNCHGAVKIRSGVLGVEKPVSDGNS